MKTLKLSLPSHAGEMLEYISSLQWSAKFSDLTIYCSNGKLKCHCAILSAMSPFLQSLLKSEPEPELFLPQIPVEDVKGLLCLLYSGSANMYKRNMQELITLTNILKLVSIPVVAEEKAWTERFPKAKVQQPSLLHTEASAKPKTVTNSPILSTQRTRSGRLVVHKRFAEDELVGDTLLEEPLSPHTGKQEDIVTFEVIESHQEPVSSTNDQLANLLSAAEAFEKADQPEPCEIAGGGIEGTDTVQLIRQCTICHKKMIGRNTLGKHMKNNHPAHLGPYKCSMCDKTLESGLKLLRHLYTHEGRRAKAIAEGQKFICNLDNCKAEYTTETRLNEHVRKKHGISAGLASAKFACNMHEDHPGEIQCTHVFPTALTFVDHMKNVHNLKPWLCTVCPKRFQERQNHLYHMMTHEGKRGFVCDICQKSFANPRQLYSHRALHLGKRFLCSHCGFKARSTANLRGHIKTKHEAKTFECIHCSKRFSSNNNLNNHLRIHTGETPYECELCNVKFKRVHHLNAHLESKVHQDIMASLRRKGVEVPDRLDPSRRHKRKTSVDGQPSQLEHLETNVISVEEFDSSGVIVIDETQSFVMIDGQTMEIVHHANTVDDKRDNGVF